MQLMHMCGERDRKGNQKEERTYQSDQVPVRLESSVWWCRLIQPSLPQSKGDKTEQDRKPVIKKQYILPS